MFHVGDRVVASNERSLVRNMRDERTIASRKLAVQNATLNIRQVKKILDILELF